MSMKNYRIFTQMHMDTRTPVHTLGGEGERMRHRKAIKILLFSPKHTSPVNRKTSNPCIQANFPSCGLICIFYFLSSCTLGLLSYRFKIHRINVRNLGKRRNRFLLKTQLNYSEKIN